MVSADTSADFERINFNGQNLSFTFHITKNINSMYFCHSIPNSVELFPMTHFLKD